MLTEWSLIEGLILFFLAFVALKIADLCFSNESDVSNRGESTPWLYGGIISWCFSVVFLVAGILIVSSPANPIIVVCILFLVTGKVIYVVLHTTSRLLKISVMGETEEEQQKAEREASGWITYGTAVVVALTYCGNRYLLLLLLPQLGSAFGNISGIIVSIVVLVAMLGSYFMQGLMLFDSADGG